MSKERAPQKVDEDIQRGDLRNARDRLHGQIASSPDDLSLRTRLAEVYFKLQFPEMAGRYWYLESDLGPEAKAAIDSFEQSLRYDPLRILQALKFKGEIDQLPERAKDRLHALQQEAMSRHGNYPVYRHKGPPKRVVSSSIRDGVLLVTCGVLLFLGASLLVVGVVTVIGWIIR